MPPHDLDTAICALVAEEVDARLAPYQDMLQKMNSLFGGTAAPVRRGPGRPKKNLVTAGGEPAPVDHRRRRSAGKQTYRVPLDEAVAAAKKLSLGQTVTYKQGRGSFEAKVIRIDADKGTVQVERTKDGKKVVRPAAKVTA